MNTKQSQKKHPVQKSRSQRIKEEEFTLCGWNACLRAFEKRPQDIRRVFFGKERSHALQAVKKWCQSHKLPYRQLDGESMKKVAAGVHHEGVVMVVRPIRPQSVRPLLKRGLSQTGILLALDRVSNTHNVGAILRSCAYFGAEGMLIALEPDQAMITSSMARTAEGALEIVPVFDCTDLSSTLRDFRTSKTFVVGADPQSNRSLYETDIPFPCVVVLGNEREGLSPRVKRRCDILFRVPGGGALQSLNVSVTAGIILAELSHRAKQI